MFLLYFMFVLGMIKMPNLYANFCFFCVFLVLSALSSTPTLGAQIVGIFTLFEAIEMLSS